MQYRKNPDVVEAIIWKETNLDEVVPFLGTTPYKLREVKPFPDRPPTRTDLIITTPKGNRLAGKGDFIVKNKEGEIYPCRPDVFDAAHTPVKPSK